MAKIKIVKKLRKSKIDVSKILKNKKQNAPSPQIDKFKDKYLEFYDDIKIPSKKHDW